MHRHILAKRPLYRFPMNKLSVYAAIAVFLLFLWYGGSIAMGEVPDIAWGITTARFVVITNLVIDKYGHLYTGIGTILLGAVFGLLCLNLRPR